MRKISYFVLFPCLGLTILFAILWILGFVFAPSVGNLIHLLLVAAMFTSFGTFVGLVLLVISLIKK